MLHNPEATQQALAILRRGDFFQWYVVTLLALVIYVYANEASKRNYNVIFAGLALYMVHWFVEIVNAVIQHATGHALWTVPTGTAFLILVGVGIEISLMFSIAGLALSKLLPADPKMKIAGIPNRLLFALMNAALISIIEIFLAKTPVFVWVYPWWGALPVFVTVYIPFFLAAMYVHDWPRRRQITFVGGLGAVNALGLIVFGAVLGWI